MSLGNERLTNGGERLVAQQSDVAMNASPVERDLFLPIADAHRLPQGTMLLGEILKLVVREIAAEPHGREHEHLPIIETLASAIRPRIAVDVQGNPIQQASPQFAARIDVLKGLENWNDLAPTFEIQRHVADRRTIQPPLPRKCLPHPFAPRR